MGLKGVHDDATFYIDNQGNITADYGNDDVGIGDYSFDVLNYQDDQNPVFMNPVRICLAGVQDKTTRQIRCWK